MSAALMVLAALSPSLAHSAPASSPGELLAFGDNDWGQLGSSFHNNTQTPNPTPTPVSLPGAAGPVVGVATGYAHSLAVTSAGQFYAFGLDYTGQLGNSSEFQRFEANPTPRLDTFPGAVGPVTSVSSGGAFSMALTSSGQLYGFGDNGSGQLGNTTNNETEEEPNPTPTLISLPGATGPVVQVVDGGGFTLALTSTDQLYGFGVNSRGQLGSSTNNGVIKNGRAVANPTPTLITLPGATGQVTQIAAGDSHSLVLTSSGQLYSFGSNNYGELGLGTNSGTEKPNPTPTLVTLPGASGQPVQIAAGGAHSLVLTSTGQLFAFGENRFGQLGNTTNNGNREPNPTPTQVDLPGAVGQIVKISAGAYYSLALTASGQLYAFGENRFGQLGNATNDGTEKPNPTPTAVQMPGGASIDTISRGFSAYHTLVVIANLALTTRSLPPGAAGTPYSGQLNAIDGAPPYRWSAESLPPGLSIDPSSGAVSGTPAAVECVQPCSPSTAYKATFTVTDSDGIQASAPLTIMIDSPPSSPPPPPASPVISSLRQSASRWREGSGLARISRQGGSGNGPVGTTFSFSLNISASVKFSFAGGSRGRLAGKRSSAAKLSGCVRRATAGALAFAGHSGPNKVRFQGRLSSCQALQPGRYTLTVTASNAAGRSTPAVLHFTIVR